MRQKVESSNVEWVGYNEEKKELEVGFKNGGIYRFDGVPKEVFEPFAQPGISVGRYFAEAIRGKYPFERLPPDPIEQDAHKDEQKPLEQTN